MVVTSGGIHRNLMPSLAASGTQLSPFGRSALSNTGVSRTSAGQALDPVSATDPLKDATSSEYRELQELKQRDREVRQHEQAHVAAGGQYVRGGANFSYERGPDGKQYATGGEVSIDTSEIPDDPEATIRKMQVVRKAAMAPAEPSAQDRSVAAEAAMAESEARAELREQQAGEASPSSPRRSEQAIGAYRAAAGAADTATELRPSLDLTA